jgi:hypothetical protein
LPSGSVATIHDRRGTDVLPPKLALRRGTISPVSALKNAGPLS